MLVPRIDELQVSLQTNRSTVNSLSNKFKAQLLAKASMTDYIALLVYSIQTSCRRSATINAGCVV